MSDVLLYDYWRSSASYRVRIALNLAGVAYKSVSVDLLKREHKAPEHLARNPQGLVPALFIDGAVLTQSLAIIEYLAQTRKISYFPADPIACAQVRSIAYAIAMDIHPVCNLNVVAHVLQLTNGKDETRFAWMQKFIGEGLDAVEAMVQKTTGPLCYSDEITIADMCLIPQVYNAKRWGIDLTKYARITSIVEELKPNAAFVAAEPENVRPQAK